MSSGCFWTRCLLTRLAVGSCVCWTTDVNCLVKAEAISLFRVNVLPANVMG